MSESTVHVIQDKKPVTNATTPQIMVWAFAASSFFFFFLRNSASLVSITGNANEALAETSCKRTQMTPVKAMTEYAEQRWLTACLQAGHAAHPTKAPPEPIIPPAAPRIPDTGSGLLNSCCLKHTSLRSLSHDLPMPRLSPMCNREYLRSMEKRTVIEDCARAYLHGRCGTMVASIHRPPVTKLNTMNFSPAVQDTFSFFPIAEDLKRPQVLEQGKTGADLAPAFLEKIRSLEPE
mmetsp:Transcript_53359/g.141684  ORF Transcript_53359/g.141684 Transcript_53359/m.141684 type:complete len:235 (+) Transcript_53359:235-939(+)